MKRKGASLKHFAKGTLTFYVSRFTIPKLLTHRSSIGILKTVNPASIQFIYFDLDDTLLDHRQAEQRGLADVYHAFKTHFDHVALETLHETYHTHSVPLWRQYAHGEIEKHDLMRLRFERTLAALEVAGLEAEVLNAFYLNQYARHWTFPEAARAAFHTLADRFPVGILTNGFAEIQRAKFDRFPELRDRAEVLVISEEVGFMKPNPRIFAHAAEAAGTPPRPSFTSATRIHLMCKARSEPAGKSPGSPGKTTKKKTPSSASSTGIN